MGGLITQTSLGVSPWSGSQSTGPGLWFRSTWPRAMYVCPTDLINSTSDYDLAASPLLLKINSIIVMQKAEETSAPDADGPRVSSYQQDRVSPLQGRGTSKTLHLFLSEKIVPESIYRSHTLESRH